MKRYFFFFTSGIKMSLELVDRSFGLENSAGITQCTTGWHLAAFCVKLTLCALST